MRTLGAVAYARRTLRAGFTTVRSMLFGIPEQDQEAIRDRIDEGLRLQEGRPDPETYGSQQDQASSFEEYIDWRAEDPSEDLMTELLQAEFEDETGTRCRLSRAEVVNFVNLLAAAGNETTTRLIGWTGKALADHPDQRRGLVDDPALIPDVIEELLRYETSSPVQARYVTTTWSRMRRSSTRAASCCC